MGQYSNAEKCYKAAQFMVPGRFYPKYLLAKLYDRQGKGPEVVSIAHEIIDQNVKISSTAVAEILSEMKKLIIKYQRSSPRPHSETAR